MEVIQIHLETLTDQNFDTPIVLAMGNFDGVHYGHQRVIRICTEKAEELHLIPSVLTFFPHPSRVIPSKKRAQLLYPKARKYAYMEQLGIERVYELRFEQTLADLEPQEFIDRILKKLHAKHVVAGFDFCFGYKGHGKFIHFDDYRLDGISYTVVDERQYLDEKVSSTRIRTCILHGEFELAMQLLSRPFSNVSVVVSGDQRGRLLGFSTANLLIPSHFVVPPAGVYVVYARVRRQYYKGVCNIGFRPTFYRDQDEPLIEVHLFDFNKEVYGEEMEVFWIARIRSEQKFDGIEALKAQIDLDKQYALDYFATKKSKLLDYFEETEPSRGQ